MRLRTRGALAALPLALALTLTGCGSDDEGAGPRATASADRQEMGVKFAQCMRENGVPMEDPKPGHGIQLKLDGSIDRATVDKAMAACREYNPMGDAAPGSDPKAEQASRDFAACMRKNGVDEFPDPKPGQRGVQIDRKVGQDPDFPAAQQKCRPILGGPGTGAKRP